MERITRKMCERQVEFLNKALNRPPVSWIRVEGKNVAQIGNFHIERNSPGDGMTRYQLAEMHNEHGGISIVDNRTCLGASEFYTFLRGLLAGVDMAKPLSGAIHKLLTAIQLVEDSWESGDLAHAVNELSAAADDAERAIGTRK